MTLFPKNRNFFDKAALFFGVILSFTFSSQAHFLCANYLGSKISINTPETPVSLKENSEAIKTIMLWLNQGYQNTPKMGLWGQLNANNIDLSQYSTGELVVLGRVLLELAHSNYEESYSRYKESQNILHKANLDFESKARKKLEKKLDQKRALPEEVIDAFFPSFHNYSYSEKLQEITLLDSKHPLSQIAKRMVTEAKSTQNGMNDMSTSMIFIKDLHALMSIIALELSKRPQQERIYFIDEYSSFSDSLWAEGVDPMSQSGSNFFSFVDPRSRLSNLLNLYMDALIGFYGPEAHYKVNEKLKNENSGAETYSNLSYESITTSWANLKAIYDRLGLNSSHTVVDLGTAFGRPGHALALWKPQVSFQGFDIVDDRIKHAQQISEDTFDGVSHFEVKDFATEDIPLADVYFLYEPATKRDTIKAVNKIRKTVKDHNKQSPTYIVAVGATGVLIPVLERRKWLIGHPHISVNGQHVAHLYEISLQDITETPEESRINKTLSLENIRAQDIESVLIFLEKHIEKFNQIYSEEVETILLERAHPGMGVFARQALNSIIKQKGVSSSESLLALYKATRRVSVQMLDSPHPWPKEMYIEVLNDFDSESNNVSIYTLDDLPFTDDKDVKSQLHQILSDIDIEHLSRMEWFSILKFCGKFKCDDSILLNKLHLFLKTSGDLEVFQTFLYSDVGVDFESPEIISFIQKIFDGLYSKLKKDLKNDDSSFDEYSFLHLCGVLPQLDCKDLVKISIKKINKSEKEYLSSSFKKILQRIENPSQFKFKSHIHKVLEKINPAELLRVLSELKKWGFLDIYEKTIKSIAKLELRQFSMLLIRLDHEDLYDLTFKEALQNYIDHNKKAIITDAKHRIDDIKSLGFVI